MKTLVAIGAAFLDIVVRCSSPDLAPYGAELNSSRFLTKDQYLCVKKQLKNPSIIPGGSVANATVIFAKLGGQAVFGTTIGNDEEGKLWKKSLTDIGIDTKLYTCNHEPTGGCLVFVHPNGQRTMRSYPGTENVADNDLENIPINKNSIVFLEGYGLNSKNKVPIYLKALEKAKNDEGYIVINASDPSCVKGQRDLFVSLLQNTADLIIMNEEEACELVKGDLKTCIAFIRETKKCAVITLGATGAIAVYGENIWFCPARDVQVIDTTGAGDGFAGGFLYGLSAGWTISECLQLGSYMAGEVVSRIGARIDGNLKNIVKDQKRKHLLVRQFENQVIDS